MNTYLLPGESIAMKKTCLLTGDEFWVTDRDIDFYDQMSPVFSGKKYSIPVPTLSPVARMQRRMAFRNERFLYENTSCLTGKKIVSMYHPEEEWRVCETKLWHGDSWSAYEYGQKIDFSKPFLDQVHALWKKVPMMTLYQTGPVENCDYCNWFGGKNGGKNCYLCFNGSLDEDCMYMKGVIDSKSCFDLYFGKQNQYCYESVNINECNNVLYSQDCTNCADCRFCVSCVGCRNCFGCANLANQEYCIFNEKFSPEVYVERMRSLRLSHENIDQIIDRVHKFHHSHPVRFTHNLNVEASIGDYLIDCKQVIGYEVVGSEGVKYACASKKMKDCMDMYGYGYFSDHLLESLGSGNSARMAFTASCDTSSDVYYSAWCILSNHLFGCVGMKHGKYSVLNSAYSAQEYEIIVGRIIDHMVATGEWGEFFHPRFSPFGYNETIGNDDQPLDRETIQKRGWRWYDVPKKERNGEYVTPLDTAQYDASKVGDDLAAENITRLLGGIVRCEKTGEPFRILREELPFYIKNDLPIPRIHPQARYNTRLQYFNKKHLNDTACTECGKIVRTTYDPEKRKILCEDCYRKLVY